MTVSSELVADIKTIAVVGAGPCGAGVAKALLAEQKFGKIQVFEKKSDFGGLWRYTNIIESPEIPGTDPNNETKPVLEAHTGEYIWPSAAYDNLDTNVPAELMAYSGVPWPKHVPIFPLREDVLEYFVNYSEPIRSLTSFNTKVVEVKLNKGKKWEVTTRPVNKDTNGGQVESNKTDSKDITQTFDAVCFATGNYDVPYIPDQKGLKEWNEKFPGSVTHSKTFKRPSDYAGEKILVVGNSASAADLAFQLATTLKMVIYKSIRSPNRLAGGKDDRIVDVAEVDHYDAETQTVHLRDGTVLEGITKIFFATGYLKSLPSLKEINKSDKPLITNGARVEGLYQQVISYNYPGLAVIGLPRFILPTRTSETQGTWLARVWSGRIDLPSVEKMIEWEQNEIKLKGVTKSFHDLIFPDDVIYSNNLNREVYAAGVDLGLFPLIWNKEQSVVRAAVKPIKEAYIAYKQDTGIYATTVDELEEKGYLVLPEVDTDFLDVDEWKI